MRKLKGLISAVMAVIMVISGTGFYGAEMTFGAETESNVVYTDSSAFEFDYGSGTITGYTGSDTDVVIPESIDGVKVEVIGDNAFENCYLLTSVMIPKGVTSIGSYAFSDCDSLKSITIPDGVTSIGTYAFQHNDLLTSVTIPGSIRNWRQAFKNCRGLESVEVKNGVNCIGYQTFKDCKNLKSIIIPDSVTSIDGEAFSGCQLLESVAITDNVTSIGEKTFFGCQSLESVTIPDSVINMGSQAFYNCSGLKSVTVNSERIGEQAFYNCSNLNNVIIGSQYIDASAFAGCISLESVEFKESVKSIGNSAFSSCNLLTSITIPDSVTSIGTQAFYNCSGLKSATVSSESIGEQAFYNCSNLNNIVIDSKYIDSSAFAGCIRLSSVEIKEGVKSIGDSAFKNCIELKEISLPNGIISIGSTAFSGTNIERVYCYSGGVAANSGLYPDGAEIVYLDDEKSTEIRDESRISIWDFGGVEESDTSVYRNYISRDFLDSWEEVGDSSSGNQGKFINGGTFDMGGGLSLVTNANDRMYNEGPRGVENNADAIFAFSDGYTAKGMWYANGTGGDSRRCIHILNVSAGSEIKVYTGSSNAVDNMVDFTYLGTEGTQSEEQVSAGGDSTIMKFIAKYDGDYKIWFNAAGGKPLVNRIVLTPPVNVSVNTGLLELPVDSYIVEFKNETTGEITEAEVYDKVANVKLTPGYTFTVTLKNLSGDEFSEFTRTIEVTVDDFKAGSKDVSLVATETTTEETTVEDTTELTTEAVPGFSIYGDIATASNGSAELTFRINENPGIANYTVFVTYDADVLMAKSGTAGDFDLNGDAVNNQINYVPEAGNSDYDGADGVKTAAQLGKIKITGLSDTNVTTADAVAFTIDFDVLTTSVGRYPVNVYIVSAGNDTSDILLSNCEGYAGYVVVETTEQTTETTTSATVVEPGEAANFELWLDDMAVDGVVATKAYTGDVALTTGETVSLGDSILELQGEGDEQYTQSYAAAVGVIRDGKTVNGYKAGKRNANANDINPIPSQGDGCAIVFTPAATGMLNTYFVSTSFLRVWDFDTATGERYGYTDSEVAAESYGVKVEAGHTYVLSTTGKTNNMAYCGFEYVVDAPTTVAVLLNNINANPDSIPNLEIYLTDAILGGEPVATVKADTTSVDLSNGHTYTLSTNDGGVKATVAGSDRFTATGEAITIDLEDIPDVTLTGEITGAAEGVTGLTFTNMVNGTVYTATITGNTYTVDLKPGDYDTSVTATNGAFTQDRVSVAAGGENVNEVYVEIVDPSKPAAYNPADLFKLEHSEGVVAREAHITAKPGDTITVPVDGAAVVTVSSYYQAAFTVNGSEVFGSDSNSTSQIDTFTVNTAEGDTAAVITFTDSYNGTAIGTSYITSISVVPVVAYKNEINVPGDYATLTDAVAAIKGMIDRPEGEEGRVTINMTADIEEQVVFDAPYITLNGNGHTLSWYYGVGTFYYSVDPYTGLYSESLYRDKYSSSEANVSLWGGVAIIRGDNFIAENTTFLNTYNYYVTEKEASDVEHSVESMPERVLGADVTSYAFKERSNAFYIDADNIEVYNCKILSSQDTLGRNSSTVLGYHAYFKDCVIGGNTDYICGEFTAIFDNCELQWKTFANDALNNSKVGFITAPKTSPYIFRNCTVTTSGLEGDETVTGYYGRTWGADSEAYFINSETNGYISADGWGEMSSGEGVSSLFYEYNNTSNGRPFVSNGAYSKVLEDEALIASMTSDAVINDYLNGWTPVSYEPYTAPEGKLWGDVNSDGTVDVLDVSLTLDYTLQPEKVENFDAAAADVNGDGIVNSTDVALILQKVLDSSFLLPGESVEIPGEITEDTTEATIEGREVIITPEYSIGGDTLTVKYNAALGANAGFNNYTMFLTFDPAVLTPVSAADGDIALADKDATGADITVSASNAETITAQFTNAPLAGNTDFEGADGVKTQAELGKVKVAYCIFDKDFSQSATGALPEFTSSGTLFTVTYNINDAAALNGTVLGANVQTLDTVSSDLGVLGTADVLVNEVAVNTSYEPGTEETTIIVEGDTAKYPVTGGYMYININTGEIIGCDKTVAGVVIPDEILSGVAVTSIGYGAFNGCSNLTEITIPESITSIGNYAFNNCGLTTVYCYKDSFADNTNLYPPGIEIIYLNYKAEKLFENSPKDVEIKESNDGWNIVKENGAFYAQSTNTDNNSTSSLSVTVEGPGILYYEASVSSEDGGDYLRTNINGRKQAISGSKYTFDAPYVNCIVLQEGENVITWEYDKDGSGSDGQDCAWIKNLRVADIGDSNLDGKVDITDVILGQRYIADNSAITDVLGQKAADYNGDGEVDKKDTAYVLKEIIKNIV